MRSGLELNEPNMGLGTPVSVSPERAIQRGLIRFRCEYLRGHLRTENIHHGFSFLNYYLFAPPALF
jgi:hypothetical protein